MILLAFTATTFLSALLLFSVQPMFTKMVLPKLGGSTSVWAVALLFFQAALLAGYAYAHFLNRNVASRMAGWVHLAVCALAFLALPIGLPLAWREPPPGDAYLWQLGLFTVAVGLPFFAVSANAPLLQAWFARTGHVQANDPYFMYGASNLGSLIALLGYPFLLEPSLGLAAQSQLWTWLFLALMAAIGFCYLLMLARRSAPAAAVPATSAVGAEPTAVAPPVSAPALSEALPTAADRARWVGLALVPSALLTAFTTHVATDIASAPLIWVIPLSLYLLTFVLVFRERSIPPADWIRHIHLIAVITALAALAQNQRTGWTFLSPIGGIAFFMTAMVAHRTLYECRPAARHLTEFYLWMSFGGVLGGLFAALIAPKIFSEVLEYPLLLALSFACRPGALRLVEDWRERHWLALYFVGGVLALYLFRDYYRHLMPVGDRTTVVIVLALGAMILIDWLRPDRRLATALIAWVAIAILPSYIHRGDAVRSYFGVLRVYYSGDGQHRLLTHGTTLHGSQRVMDAEGQPVTDAKPATYYYPESPMAKAINEMRNRATADGRKAHVGVVGLGTGSLACYAGPGEDWRFYEIDPAVVQISKVEARFTFLQRCLPEPNIIMGDARLTLEKEPDGSLDVLIVDAFSSDAVPVHLMTKEAIELYLRKVKEQGIVVLHISNRYLDLEAVVSATAALVAGTKGVIVDDTHASDDYDQLTSTVAILARTDEALSTFSEWKEARGLDAAKLRGWTDDYSDILGSFLLRYRGSGSTTESPASESVETTAENSAGKPDAGESREATPGGSSTDKNEKPAPQPPK